MTPQYFEVFSIKKTALKGLVAFQRCLFFYGKRFIEPSKISLSFQVSYPSNRL